MSKRNIRWDVFVDTAWRLLTKFCNCSGNLIIENRMLGRDFWSVISVDKTRDGCCPTSLSKMAGDIDLGVSLSCFTCSKGVQINLTCFYNAIFIPKFLRQLWWAEIWARFLVRQPCAKWIFVDQNSILHCPDNREAAGLGSRVRPWLPACWLSRASGDRWIWHWLASYEQSEALAPSILVEQGLSWGQSCVAKSSQITW